MRRRRRRRRRRRKMRFNVGPVMVLNTPPARALLAALVDSVTRSFSSRCRRVLATSAV